MPATDQPTTAAWGVARRGEGLCRVRVERRGGGIAIGPVEGVTEGDAARWAPPADEPLGVALVDLGVLYRRFALPPGEGETLRQMAESQLEVVSPVPVEGLAWSCRRLASGDVLIAGARRQSVDATPWAGSAAAVVPAAAGIADAWARLFPRDTPALLVHIGRDATSVVLTGEAPAQALAAVGDGLDSVESPDAAAVAAWSRELAVAARRLIAEAAVPPTRCVVLHTRAADELLDACRRATGLAAERVGAAPGVADAEVVDALPAVGAALAALDPAAATLPLVTRSPEPGARRRLPLTRRGLVAAGAAVLAVASIYVLDRWEASRVAAAASDAAAVAPADTAAASDAAAVARALGIGRYLLDRPTPPLWAIAAISRDAPRTVQVKRFQYRGNGGVRFGGEVQGIGELDQALSRLTKSPPLTGVEMRSGSVERDKWTFEVEADLVPLYRHVAFAARGGAGGEAEAPAAATREVTP